MSVLLSNSLKVSCIKTNVRQPVLTSLIKLSCKFYENIKSLHFKVETEHNVFFEDTFSLKID